MTIRYLVISLISQIEVHHHRNGLHIDQEQTLIIAHLAEVMEKSEILCQMLKMRFCAVLQLHKIPMIHNSEKLEMIKTNTDTVLTNDSRRFMNRVTHENDPNSSLLISLG